MADICNEIKEQSSKIIDKLDEKLGDKIDDKTKEQIKDTIEDVATEENIEKVKDGISSLLGKFKK